MAMRPTIAPNMLNTLTGTIDDYQLAGGEENKWMTVLDGDITEDDGTAMGTAKGGSPAEDGSFSATFHGSVAAVEGVVSEAQRRSRGVQLLLHRRLGDWRLRSEGRSVTSLAYIKSPRLAGRMDQRRAAQKLPFFFALVMPTTLFAIIVVFLLSVPPALAASAKPDVIPGVQLNNAPAFTPEAPPAVCRDCGGLRYYPPSASPSAVADAPVSATPGRVHLSADPRVTTARLLVGSNRFAEALEILRPLAPDHPDQTDVQFLLGLAAVRGSQTRGLPDEEREALLDEAIAAFRSILITPARIGARAPGTGLGLLFQGGE